MPKSRFRDQVASNSARQQASANQYGYLNLPRGVQVFKEEPDTKVRLDFLPYEVKDPKHMDRDDERGIAQVGSLWYKRPFKKHGNVGVENETYVCLTTIGKKCPICEFRAQRVKDGNASKEELKSLKPSKRNLYIVLPIGVKDYDERPYIWDISQYIFQDPLNDEIKEDPDARAIFPDIEEGLTLRIRFGEATIDKNKFADVSRIDFEKRDQQYTDSILKKVPNLDDCLTILSYDQLRAKFFELDEDGDSKTAHKETTEEPVRRRMADDDEPPRRRMADDEPPARKREVEEEPPVRRSRPADDDEPVRRTPKDKDDGDEPVRRREAPKDDDRQAKREAIEAKTSGSSDKVCPYKYTFGSDCEKYDACDSCKVWEACYEEKQRLKAKARGA